ncbi:uncharacterized protein L969DRAFT_94378 [Mixia osmundae IAM 14324]|uniref:DUS-like FMN-binding domain-containing protein n=1 Tax=Mixia osmundae (strain CBS 9802 / IAM 14324 / JCM 22182 / KY 12970) TaxID=764103 RepID=G7E3A8_MIXOS|nr:uncharacterized protein L969DRAFT_94378 [Mixia osmundae IAM 14324]KEI39305.1 hypothetical protein L969DRAFT_94378 [Mixia osmundae IAM 14324]GAA97318.1 hypothetical protein E5Q_03996 [Mixia osmundae IAM 14324]
MILCNSMTGDSLPVRRLRPAELVKSYDHIGIAAPMVRYSKLPFRMLAQEYGAHITHTPMILAQEFGLSATARDSDFTVRPDERGLFRAKGRRISCLSETARTRLEMMGEAVPGDAMVADADHLVQGCMVIQFAASEPVALADAAELVAGHVDAIDINCGCPQSWAYKECIGSYLLRQPDKVRNLIRGVKLRLGEDFPVHIKIRIDTDPQLTAQLMTTAVEAGAELITVHGRTRNQPSDSVPVNLSGIQHAVQVGRKLGVPVVANGDIFCLDDARRTLEQTGADAVMAARGLMSNPCLFAGYKSTPGHGINRFVELAVTTGFNTGLFHRTVAHMTVDGLPKSDALRMNAHPSIASLIEHVAKLYPVA